MTRVLLRSLSVLVVASVSIVIGWRVLRPAELSYPATTPYPSLVAHAAGLTGRVNAAPLIVDGRVRVFAAKRQLHADGPVDGKTVYTPRWSFRRWPAQLTGVVASGRTVVSRWSDGLVVAIDARTGREVWRVSSFADKAGYSGYLTGAATVWAPPGLHTGAGLVLVSGGGGQVAAYSFATGARAWSISACGDGFTTAGGQYVCPTGAYALADGRPVADWPAGPFTPIGCPVAASGCEGMRSTIGWLTGGATPARSAALDRPGSTVAAGVVFYPSGGATVSADPARAYPAGQILGASNGKVLLLRPDRSLLEFDPVTGYTLADVTLRAPKERELWTSERYDVTDGHLAMERLALHPSAADPGSPDYYYSTDPVVIAAL